MWARFAGLHYKRELPRKALVYLPCMGPVPLIFVAAAGLFVLMASEHAVIIILPAGSHVKCRGFPVGIACVGKLVGVLHGACVWLRSPAKLIQASFGVYPLPPMCKHPKPKISKQRCPGGAAGGRGRRFDLTYLMSYVILRSIWGLILWLKDFLDMQSYIPQLKP